MKNKHLVLSTVLSTSVLVALPVLAQEDLPPGFYPGLGLSLATDDNIFKTETSPVSDNFYLINPSLLYKSEFGKHGLDLSYVGNYGYYATEQDENYTDSFANADLSLDLSPKLDVDVQAGYIAAHEPRSTAGTDLVVSPTPNLWNETRFFSEVVYGRRTNIGQVKVSYEGTNRAYTNNSQEERDRNVDKITGTFYYNYSAKTALLFEAASGNINYVTATAPVNLDSTETRYLVGGTWEATAKTTGEIKAGAISKDLKDATLDDFNGTGFDVSVEWRPKTYSALQLTASKYTRESPIAGESFYVSEVYDLAYRHAFSDRIELNANVTPGVDTYGSGSRTDNLMGMGVGVKYKLNRLLDIGGNYINTSRRSNAAGADFDSTIIMLTISTRTTE